MTHGNAFTAHLANTYAEARDSVNTWKQIKENQRKLLISRIGVDVTETHGDYRVTTTRVKGTNMDWFGFVAELKAIYTDEMVDELMAKHQTESECLRLNVTKVDKGE